MPQAYKPTVYSLYMASAYTFHFVIYFLFLVSTLLTVMQQTVLVWTSWWCWQLVLCLSIDKEHTMLALTAQASLGDLLHHLCLNPTLPVQAYRETGDGQHEQTLMHTVHFKANCLSYSLSCSRAYLTFKFRHFYQCRSADLVIYLYKQNRNNFSLENLTQFKHGVPF